MATLSRLPVIMPLLWGGWAVLGAWHVGLGSDPAMNGALLLIAAVGLARLSARQVWFSDLIVIGLAIYAALLTLVIKGALGQPLQENLHHPRQSTLLLLLAFGIICGLSALARWVARRRAAFPIADHFNDPAVQRALFLPLLALGLAVLGLHIALRPRLENGLMEQGAGFGGFGSLYFILLLALSLGLSLAMRGNGRGAVRVLCAAGLLILTLSLGSNTKKEFGEYILLLGGALFTYGRRPRLRFLLPGALVVALAVLYLAPLVHLTRDAATGLGVVERLELAYEVLEAHGFNPFILREAEGRFLTGFSHAFSEHGSYIWPSTLGLDRFMLILPVDQVLRSLPDTGAMGYQVFLREITTRVLPSALVAKNSFAGADLIAWEHGIRRFGNSARPVIGLTASALAAGGTAGVLIVPVVVMLPLMLVGNLIFGPLRQNALAPFLIGMSWILAEYTFDALAVFGLRQMVIAICFLWVLARITRPRADAAPSPAA